MTKPILDGEFDLCWREDAMEQVAWVREHGNCRLFCLTLGHDNEAWSNPGFQGILRRGIAWSAGTTMGTDQP